MRLLFVGDIAMGDHPKAVGFGFYSKYKKGIPSQMADNIIPEGITADIIFGNLEFGLAGDEIIGNSVSEVYCRGIKSYVPFLKVAGFSIVNMANNHQFQHGRKHFIDTVENLKAGGISVCGTKEDFSTKNIIGLKDTSIAFLGWADRPRQDFSEDPLYNEFSPHSSYREIERMSRLVDILCVSIHWGEEFVGIPNERERALARAMVDRGASIVIGHHPHVIREVESYRGGIIAYSLGNFICDMVWNEKTVESGCLCVDIEKGKVRGHSFKPAIIGNDYFPHFLPEDQAVRFLQGKYREYQRLSSLAAKKSYDYLSQYEMRRHQLLTGAFVLRNLHRYQPRFLYNMMYHAVISRMPFTKKRST